jgi:stage III sporulation protein AG
LDYEKIKKIKSELFEKKKNLYNIAIALFAGIILLAVSSRLNTPAKSDNEISSDNSDYLIEYEKRIEEKIVSYLKETDGVGQVSASVVVKSGREKIVQNDTSYQTDEMQLRQTKEKKSVYDNDKTPFVVLEMEPEIEGVVIVAQGGADIVTKQKIISSVSALLGVDVHKIEVLKMKTGG